MKCLVLAINLFILLLGSACQVKESSSDGGGLVSGHKPTTNSFQFQTPTAKTYVSGETLSIVVTFPFDVTVTGTPQLNLTVGATARTAAYTSGTGTTSLTFQYTFVVADNDSNGITVNSLGLNGGTLTFDGNGVVTNCDVTTLKTKTFSSVRVDNTAPNPTAMALSNLAGFYHKGEKLNFTVTFSEAVYVTGTPRISMDFQYGPAVYANYTGGSGTTSLGFSITIDNATGDTNTYDTINGSIDLNGGTIKDSVGNVSTLDISGFTAAVRTSGATRNFDGRLPYVVSVTPPANGNYSSAMPLDIVVEFDRAVTVNTAGGTPYIAITIGSNVRQATYQSGSGTNLITFRYVTIPGDVDADGIAIANTITANSGTIIGTAAPTQSYFLAAGNNLFTVPSTTGVIASAIQPQPISAIRNIDAYNRIFPTAIVDNYWIIGQDLLISVGFNTEMYVNQTSGTPRIPITIGATTRYATYLSGGNGQTTLVFRYVVQEGDLDTDGSIAIGSIDLNGGNIVDGENTNTLLTIPTSSLTTTYVDGVRPTVSNATVPAGTYSVNTAMNITLTWSEAVNYSSTTSSIALTFGATPVNANYVSGSNTTTMIYRPTISNPMTDTDGIAMAGTLSGTAVIKDQAGNTASVLTFTPPTTTSVLVDTTVPSVVSVDSPPADTYNLGDVLEYTVYFNEPVNVTVNGTEPRIAMTIGAATRNATYFSGTGTDTIVFRYTVVAGDSDLNGIPNPTTLSVVNPAYIRDLGLNGAASYAITTSLTGVVVDAVAPTISARTVPANGTYDAGDILQFTTTFTEAVTVTGTPRIEVAAQTGTLYFDYVSGSGTTVLTFRYTVQAADLDMNGLPNPINTISLNGGTIQDAQSNNAALTFTNANLASVFITYPNLVVWTNGTTFVNRSPVAGITTSASGASSTISCVGTNCRAFTGDDSFNLGTAITGAEEVFIVFRTPAALSNRDLFDTDISLVNDGTRFDITSSNADINLDGATSSGTNHDVNMTVGSTHIMHVIFNPTQNYGIGALIPTTYSGGIGDVIITTSPLTPAQRTEILNYLNTKY